MGITNSGAATAAGRLGDAGIRNLVGFYLRSPFNRLRQQFLHFGIRFALIGLGALFVIPKTDPDRLCSFGCNQKRFFLKTLLSAKDRDNFIFERPVEVPYRIGL